MTCPAHLISHKIVTSLVNNNLYNLSSSAQIFYRRFILHHSFPLIEVNLNTIVQRMNFKDTNTTNLIHTIEENSLEQLRRNGLILSYEKKEGLSGLKYIITLPEKTSHNREGIDGP